MMHKNYCNFTLVEPKDISEEEQNQLRVMLEKNGEDPRAVAGQLVAGTLSFVRSEGAVDGFLLVKRVDSMLLLWDLQGEGLKGRAKKFWTSLQEFFYPLGFTKLGMQTKRKGLVKMLGEELGWTPKVYLFEEEFTDVSSGEKKEATGA